MDIDSVFEEQQLNLNYRGNTDEKMVRSVIGNDVWNVLIHVAIRKKQKKSRGKGRGS